MGGHKRHILVDTLGLLLNAYGHTTDITDRDDAALLLEKLADSFPRLQYIWADMGVSRSRCRVSQGATGLDGVDRQAPFEVGALARRCRAGADAEVDDPAAPMGHRAHLRLAGRYQRMSKEYEYLTETSEAFIYAAMVWLMLRRLARTVAETS